MSCDDTKKREQFLNPYLSGVVSSVVTTVAYQPLELIRTRLQLKESRDELKLNDKKYFGNAFYSARRLVLEHNLTYLWRGTGASLFRYVPGVSLYFGSLNILQNNFSAKKDRPDSGAQAFCFGVISRSIVSFSLLPVAVVKVRYESGQHNYKSLFRAIGTAYISDGWIGIVPTLLRDSLFSGIYYLCYTELKNIRPIEIQDKPRSNFINGVISGFISSVITNPFDVLKTNIQAGSSGERSMLKMGALIRKEMGLTRLLDGLLLRALRRTLLSATTWTLYEYLSSTT